MTISHQMAISTANAVSKYDGNELFTVFLYSLRLTCTSETSDSKIRHFWHFRLFCMKQPNRDLSRRGCQQPNFHQSSYNM